MNKIILNKFVFAGIIIFFIILLLTSYYFFILSNDNKIIENIKSNQFISTNALTMMYETEEDSGEYQVSNDTTWPKRDYVFNETLSKCENGGTLSWNSETNRVVMQTNSSEKCYVYFDKEPNLMEFTITDYDSGNTMIYYAEDGMTWYDWINSEYNTSTYGTYCNLPDSFVALFDGSTNGGFVISDVDGSDLIVEKTDYGYYGSLAQKFGPCI